MLSRFHDLINLTGNYASVIGLLITLVGFAVTIRNARKSKEASEQAEKAVTKVREDLRKIDTVGDLSKAISIMEEIKRLHRQEAWLILPDRYSELKKILVSIRSANPNLRNEQRAVLQGAIQHFTDIDKIVEKHLVIKDDNLRIHQLNQVVSLQIDKLVEVLTEIRSGIGE